MPALPYLAFDYLISSSLVPTMPGSRSSADVVLARHGDGEPEPPGIGEGLAQAGLLPQVFGPDAARRDLGEIFDIFNSYRICLQVKLIVYAFSGLSVGKYYIFLSLIQTGHYALAVVATLYVAVAIYYYFKIVRSMFIQEQLEKAPLATGLGMRLALGASALLTLGIGIYPEPFLRFAASTLVR